VTDDNHETLARSLFSSEAKKPVQRRRSPKAPEPSPDTSDTISEPQPEMTAELSTLQGVAQAWQEKYQQAQSELETLRPQLQRLQTQLHQQTKLIQEQQEAIQFWQQKTQTPTTLPTRPHQTLKPMAVPPKKAPLHPPDPLPDFMLD